MPLPTQTAPDGRTSSRRNPESDQGPVQRLARLPRHPQPRRSSAVTPAYICYKIDADTCHWQITTLNNAFVSQTASTGTGVLRTAAPNGGNVLKAYSAGVSVIQGISLTNYGFESGSLSSWTAENGTTASIVTSTVHSGTYAAAMTGAGNAGLYQAVSGLRPGQQYVISAWVNVTAGQLAALFVNDSVSNASAESADQGVTSGWQYISLPFTADSTGVIGIHLWSAGAGTIYWDDVSVMQSASYTLSTSSLGSGLGSAWRSRALGRRRRRVNTH